MITILIVLTLDCFFNARDKVLVADDRKQDEKVQGDKCVAQGGAVLPLVVGEKVTREV